MKAKKAAFYGVALALSLAVSYIEYLIPVMPALPSAKLGIANVMFIFLIINGKFKDACIINFLRIVLSSLLFGNVSSFIYSLSGAILAFAIMLLLSKFSNFGFVGISCAAGALHNIGQLAAAMLLLDSSAVISYLPYLIAVGGFCGALTGILAFFTDKYLGKKIKSL